VRFARDSELVGAVAGGTAVGAVWALQEIAAAKAVVQRTIKGSSRRTVRRIARFLCGPTARVYAGASRMASNGEVERPHDAAGMAPRAHTVPKRPRSAITNRSRSPPMLLACSSIFVCAEDRIDPSLVTSSAGLKPLQHIRIDAK